jgi:hypothetical protein
LDAELHGWASPNTAFLFLKKKAVVVSGPVQKPDSRKTRYQSIVCFDFALCLKLGPDCGPIVDKFEWQNIPYLSTDSCMGYQELVPGMDPDLNP